ncbi:transmembrane-type terpene cyclase [Paenibacillus oceani]|uniref:Uncharacterized protein n=1 Tax=Paenibacillus oceani TaxID=2772510 RepID=A0A927C9Y1_9BACL|nr:hypothetical protein [Paenibacillus oceani]MBD2863544.1 hypothetical protein [Paenibacillus oceani]
MDQAHLLPPIVELLLLIGSGVCWTAAYLFIIYRGYRNRTCGVPFAALCGNLGWEFLFSFVYPHPPVQLIFNWIWLALDLIIMLQYIRYARPQSDLFGRLKPALSYTAIGLSLGAAFILVWAVTVEFHDFEGKYAAFGLNFLMSVLFLTMLSSQGKRGQSVSIAAMKWIGTALASLLFFSLYPQSVLLGVLYVFIFALDAVYFFAIYRITNKMVRPRLPVPPSRTLRG